MLMNYAVLLYLDLRKRFEQEPINANVEASATVQLQCLPPTGLPTPEVRFSIIFLYTDEYVVRNALFNVKRPGLSIYT